MMGLTKRQQDCLRAIDALTVDGVSPTYSEIGVHIGIMSKSSVSRMIDGLVERGHLRRFRNRSRALEVIAPTNPVKSKTQIADEVCLLLAEHQPTTMAGVRAIVMEALR